MRIVEPVMLADSPWVIPAPRHVCRALLADADPQTCTDEEYDIWLQEDCLASAYARESYNASACELRLQVR